ncbi:DUF255 domain-containing protein [Streptomyces rubellomurinus]|nr:DUF255 domain-containing protein [Streptomyces rubellomurinus]
MADKRFEDEGVANHPNKRFASANADREERSDIEAVHRAEVMLIS